MSNTYDLHQQDKSRRAKDLDRELRTIGRPRRAPLLAGGVTVMGVFLYLVLTYGR